MDLYIIEVQYPGDLKTISRGYRGMSVVVVLVLFEKLRNSKFRIGTVKSITSPRRENTCTVFLLLRLQVSP